MDHALKPNTRNLSLECCKLLAACFVVFLHIPFPGTFGALVVCLSRFAVPLFFAVSGWFSYGAPAKKLLLRLRHILLLELAGDILYIAWRCIRECLSGEALLWSLMGQLPDPAQLKLWLLWNVDPFGGHLWYLSATALCYGILWIYTLLRKEKKYGLLYGAGLLLLAGFFAMSEFSRFTGIRVDYRVYRSGIFMGFPLFSLGMCLRQHRGRFPGLPLLAAGILLSILEWQYFGGYDLYIGSVLTAAGILLLTDRHPGLPGRAAKAAASFGSVSTVVYLVHLLLQEVYSHFLQYSLELGLGSREPWLRPLLILAASLATGFLWNILKKAVRK